MKKYAGIALCCVALLAGADRALCGSAEALWPMLQHDMFHTGQSISYGVQLNNAEVKFSSALGVTGISSPVVDYDGTVYIGGGGDCLFSVAPDGSSECIFNTVSGTVESTPVLSAAGILYVPTTNGRLHALTTGGTQQWVLTLDTTILSSPVIGPEQRIFIGSGPNDGKEDGFLHCISPEGKKLWSYRTGAVGYGSPAVDQFGNVYIASVQGLLYAFDFEGALLWTYEAAEGITSSPVIAPDDTIYIATPSSLIALDYSGVPKQKPFVPRAVIFGDQVVSGFAAAPAVDRDANIYIGGILGDVHSLAPGGSQRWSVMIKEPTLADPVPAPIVAAPVLDRKGGVYVRSTNYVAALAAQNGAPAGSLMLTGDAAAVSPAVEAAPVLGSRRTLYIPYADGSLYAVSPQQRVLSISGAVTGDLTETMNVVGTVLDETAEQYSVLVADTGAYALQDLYPGSYIVAPVSRGVTFTPPSRKVRLDSADSTGVDFSAVYSGPVIVEAKAAPAKIQNNAATPVLLTVEVFHALGSGHIASVQVDLAELGGSAAQEMRDDGTGGDAAAGDGIYSLSTVVTAAISIKFTALLVTVSDADNNVTRGAITIEVFNEVKDSGDGTREYELFYQPVVRCEQDPCTTGDNYFTVQYAYGGSADSERLPAGLRPDGQSAQELILQIFSPSNMTAVPDYERPIQEQTNKLRISDAQPGIWRYKVINRGLGSVQYSLTTTAAGTGVVSGSVTEAATGAPVDQADIRITSGVSTRSQSGYYLLLCPAGVFTLTASDATHDPASRSINLVSGSAVEANILLLPRGSSNTGTCPFTQVLQGRDDLQLLARQFRDAALPLTGYGAAAAAKYYRFAPEITACIARDPVLREDAAAAMLVLEPVMRQLLGGGQASLSPPQRDCLVRCLERLRQHAGPALCREIAQVLQDIGTGDFLRQLNTHRQP